MVGNNSKVREIDVARPRPGEKTEAYPGLNRKGRLKPVRVHGRFVGEVIREK